MDWVSTCIRSNDGRQSVQVRIVTAGFKPKAWQRRVINANADLAGAVVPNVATPEQFQLLRRYLLSRHPGGGMTGMDEDDYATMVEDSAVPTHLVEYRLRNTAEHRGKLVAAALTDILADGLSMVYSFFDPSAGRRGLGNYIILDHIARAKEMGLPYVYLGYWVPGSAKMSYKARFSPLESLDPEGWVALDTD